MRSWDQKSEVETSGIQTDTRTKRQTDIFTDRQTHIRNKQIIDKHTVTNRQINRQTYKQTGRHTKIQTNRQTNRRTGIPATPTEKVGDHATQLLVVVKVRQVRSRLLQPFLPGLFRFQLLYSSLGCLQLSFPFLVERGAVLSAYQILIH